MWHHSWIDWRRKTHLAISLAVTAAEGGRCAYHATLAELLAWPKEAQIAGQLSRRLQTLVSPSLMVIDEIRYLPISRTGVALRRYEHASTVLTSNKGFEASGEIFSNDVMASAFLDRRLHHCTSSTSAATATASGTTATSPLRAPTRRMSPHPPRAAAAAMRPNPPRCDGSSRPAYLCNADQLKCAISIGIHTPQRGRVEERRFAPLGSTVHACACAQSLCLVAGCASKHPQLSTATHCEQPVRQLRLRINTGTFRKRRHSCAAQSDIEPARARREHAGSAHEAGESAVLSIGIQRLSRGTSVISHAIHRATRENNALATRE